MFGRKILSAKKYYMKNFLECIYDIFPKIGIENGEFKVRLKERKYILENDIENYEEIYLDNNSKKVNIKYIPNKNVILSISVKNFKFEDNDGLKNVIPYERAKNIAIKNNSDICKVLDVSLENIETNYLVLNIAEKEGLEKVVNSKEEKRAWSIKAIKHDNKVVKIYIDAITGEIIEINQRI